MYLYKRIINEDYFGRISKNNILFFFTKMLKLPFIFSEWKEMDLSPFDLAELIKDLQWNHLHLNYWMFPIPDSRNKNKMS